MDFKEHVFHSVKTVYISDACYSMPLCKFVSTTSIENLDTYRQMWERKAKYLDKVTSPWRHC